MDVDEGSVEAKDAVQSPPLTEEDLGDADPAPAEFQSASMTCDQNRDVLDSLQWLLRSVPELPPQDLEADIVSPAEVPSNCLATKKPLQQHAGRHPPSPGDGYPESQLYSFATKKTLQLHAGRHPPSPGDGYPESQQASPRRGRHSSTRVGTRQARGMDTPKAN